MDGRVSAGKEENGRICQSISKELEVIWFLNFCKLMSLVLKKNGGEE